MINLCSKPIIEMEEITFEEYLKDKKIDPTAFKKGNKDQYCNWEEIFQQVHPNSFTAQKLFLINEIRRNYPIKIESDNQSQKKPQAKPKIRIPKK